MHGNVSDLPVTVDVEELTVREAEWGGMTVNIITCHKTLDIAPVLKGLPDDLCQCPHHGIILKGRKVVKYRDREEVLNAGDAYYMPPGHTTVTDAGTEWLELSPTEGLKETNRAVARNLAILSSDTGEKQRPKASRVPGPKGRTARRGPPS
jgi:hypothetical protein